VSEVEVKENNSEEGMVGRMASPRLIVRDKSGRHGVTTRRTDL
jgi:hypothetical protein